MLVLSRRKNECVIIGDDITVTIIEIRGDKVRLAFEHPKEVSVHRREVYDAIQGQRTEPQAPPTPVQARSEPDEPMMPAAVPPERVALSERQVAMIDRFRESIRATSGVIPSREDAVEVLLTAFEEAGRNLPAFVYGAIRKRHPS